MPRNRSDVDRETKQDEILAAATTLFLTAGVETTSMAAVASAAGVAKNTVYWYFADKDALLLAVLRRELREGARAWEAAPTTGLAARLEAVVGLFARIDTLSSAIHARAAQSPAIAEWHARFHVGADRWLAREIETHLAAEGRSAMAPAQLATTARIWTYAIEGLVGHGASAATVTEVCEGLVAQLTP